LSHLSILSCCCWCVGRGLEPPAADLKSVDAVRENHLWPNDRLGHPCDRSNSRESGEPHSPSHCLAYGKPRRHFALGARRLVGGRGGEDPSHLGTLLTEDCIESAHRTLNTHRRNGSLLHAHYALHFGLRHLALPTTCCRVTRLCGRA
jgi:hypothetical protein